MFLVLAVDNAEDLDSSVLLNLVESLAANNSSSVHPKGKEVCVLDFIRFDIV